MPVQPLTSALKCFELLDVISAQSGPIRVSELGRLIGETRGTTYQRLLTLSTAGWIERLETGSYRLTAHACRVANAAMQHAGIDARVAQILNRLSKETGETSTLVTLEDLRPVIVQRVQSNDTLRVDQRIGAELSFKDSPSGKVWLAFGPRELADQLRVRGVAVASKAEVKRVRADGYATGGGGRTLQGVAAVSVPLMNRAGACAASMSVVCPDTRFDLDRMLALLQAAANEAVPLLAE